MGRLCRLLSRHLIATPSSLCFFAVPKSVIRIVKAYRQRCHPARCLLALLALLMLSAECQAILIEMDGQRYSRLQLRLRISIIVQAPAEARQQPPERSMRTSKSFAHESFLGWLAFSRGDASAGLIDMRSARMPMSRRRKMPPPDSFSEGWSARNITGHDSRRYRLSAHAINTSRPRVSQELPPAAIIAPGMMTACISRALIARLFHVSKKEGHSGTASRHDDYFHQTWEASSIARR